MLTLVVPRVVDVPQLGALVLRIPLPVLVPEAEDAFLGPRLLLVTPRPAEDRVVASLGNGPQEGRCLQAVARRPGERVLHRAAGVDVVLHQGDIETDTRRGDVAVPELEHLGEVPPVSMCMTGKGTGAGQKAFLATCSMTMESLPPENSSTGRSNSAATSLKMWIDWASSAPRWDRRYRPDPTPPVPSCSPESSPCVVSPTDALLGCPPGPARSLGPGLAAPAPAPGSSGGRGGLTAVPAAGLPIGFSDRVPVGVLGRRVQPRASWRRSRSRRGLR